MNKKLSLKIGSALCLMCITTLCGCWNLMLDTAEEEDENTKSLNDIRFANFKENDWEDNEYIRCLRSYIDDYNRGAVEDEIPDECKDKLKGKFVVIQTQPYLMGGLLIQFVFIDRPNESFQAWVYSFVDEESETVFAFEVRTILLDEESSEELQELLKENPKLKQW
jgi:hypothetical protein